MNHLHSYWRIEYVQACKDSEDVRHLFAKLPHRGDDREALILYRAPHTYLLLNKYPYNAGHLLAIPYREVSQLTDLTSKERADLMDTIVKAQNILNRSLKPDGFNIGFNIGSAAGAGIPSHLHCHIVPRWEGDTNFMPVLGDTRVLPEALVTLWQRLRQHLD